MVRSRWLISVAGIVCFPWTAAVAPAQEAKPDEPIEYQPFFPDQWKEKNQSTKMIPWEGERVVFLTTRADLDGKTMAVFLKRLDAGWKLYEDLIGEKPAPFRQHNGKVTIAAVPDSSYTCGFGCGYIGMNGIEVAGFYREKSFHFGDLGDYQGVRKNPGAFAHYYFYEMGRNYFVFGDRHSAFSTGFAVFMRHVCMDTLRCEDLDKQSREAIDRAEAIHAESALTFPQAFPQLGDDNVMYASVMLKLRKDYGGDEWVKRFYAHIQQCPPLPPNNEENRVGQVLYWVIAASAAAKQDLSPLFEKRWRFPLRPEVWSALKAVDWGKEGLTATAVLNALPAEHLPPALADALARERDASRPSAAWVIGVGALAIVVLVAAVILFRSRAKKGAEPLSGPSG